MQEGETIDLYEVVIGLGGGEKKSYGQPQHYDQAGLSGAGRALFARGHLFITFV